MSARPDFSDELLHAYIDIERVLQGWTYVKVEQLPDI
jgi:hypothetical protein